MFGYYSEKQFNVLNDHRNILDNSLSSKSSYIYYIDNNDNIVQVTEVKKNKIKNEEMKFNDTIYVGELKKFHSVSNKKLDLNN